MLYEEDWEAESVISYSTSIDLRRDSGSQEDSLLDIYLDIETISFSSVVAFKSKCRALLKIVDKGIGCPFLAFSGVRIQDFEGISRLRERKASTLPRMSCLYDSVEQTLIVKLMGGLAHDGASGEFVRTFESILTEPARSSLFPTGTCRYVNSRGRSKEPDISYRPTTRLDPTAWPSFVVEISVSESLSQLQADMAYWLRNSNSQTRVAVLLHVNKAARTILIERWHCVPRMRSARPGITYGPSISRTHALMLDAIVPYIGDSLVLPAHQIYDQDPATIPGVAPGDFIITTSELDAFNNRFWSTLNLVARYVLFTTSISDQFIQNYQITRNLNGHLIFFYFPFSSKGFEDYRWMSTILKLHK